MKRPCARLALASLLLCAAALLAADQFRPKPAHASTPPDLNSSFIIHHSSFSSAPPAFVVDADVQIDFTDLHQTIDGFGAAQPQYYYANSSVQDHAFTDMGLSILRMELQFDFETTNDNPDPAAVNLPGFDPTCQSGILGVAQGAQTRGVNTFLACPWSPPAWMKTNNNVVGGALTAGQEPELAEYFSTYVERMQAVYGVPVTHMCLQNEPNVTPGWWGCKYTPAQMATLVTATGARFALDSRTTQIVVADNSTLAGAPAFITGVMNDPTAAPYVKVLSTHPYDITWSNPDSAIANWNTLRGVAQGYGLKLWQTEHSNYNDFSATAGNWTSAMLMAQHMHVAITQGDVSAWLYWNLNRQNQTPTDGYGQSLYVDQLPIAKAYAMGQFAKHVRPGAIRVGATSTDANVLVEAYRDNAAAKAILIFINRDVVSKSAGVAVTGLPIDIASQGWRSSVGESHLSIPGLDLSTGTATAILPANSITTFVCDLLVTKTLTLTAPNGGEIYPAGTAQTATWVSSGPVGPVDVFISYDGGAHYITVATNRPNTGSYTFFMPSLILTNLRVKITESGNPTVTDTSNASFSTTFPPGRRRRACAIAIGEKSAGLAGTDWLMFAIGATGLLMVTLKLRHAEHTAESTAARRR
ncbi:MAG TPA: glycoside hydrolase [Planctomycetota bacterium]|nr:glycoside hydrolase [Planctomycetota bacterium]